MSVIEDAQRTVPWVLAGQTERCGSKHIARITGKYAGELTYGELLRAAETGSTGLREEFGVQVGEVAGVFMPNSVDFLTAWFSCLYAGVIDAAINYELKKGTLLTALSSMSVQAVFTDGDGFERLLDPEVSGYLARLKVIVLSGVTSPTMARDRLRELRAATKVVLLSDLLASGPRKRLWETLDRSTLASIRYTSGTTGLPKGVMHTHAFLLNKSANHGRAFTLGSDDVLYSPFPLYHGLSGIMGVIGALQAGATFATTSRFSASGYWNDCRAVGATLAHILFPMVPMLMKQPPSDDDRRHHVRYLYAAWPNAEFRERFGAEFIQMYAQTEVGIVAYRREGSEEGSRCVGRPIDVMEVGIVDEQDRAVAPGTVGEIAVRPKAPDNIMCGYYDNYAATARSFRNLWHHTGDAGYLTEFRRALLSGPAWRYDPAARRQHVLRTVGQRNRQASQRSRMRCYRRAGRSWRGGGSCLHRLARAAGRNRRGPGRTVRVSEEQFAAPVRSQICRNPGQPSQDIEREGTQERAAFAARIRNDMGPGGTGRQRRCPTAGDISSEGAPKCRRLISRPRRHMT